MIKPNVLTLLRILLAFFIPFLLISQNPVNRLLAFFVFLAAGLTDLLDGYVARKTKTVTNLGKILDPVADKILNLGAMFALSALKVYSVWWIVLIAAREIVITTIRIRCLVRSEVIGAETVGKVKTALQSFSLFVSYLYLLIRDYHPDSSLHPIACGLSYLCLLAAVFITLYSGARFFREKSRQSLLYEFLATAGYVGYLPWMPGTFGSLAGVFVYCVAPRGALAYGALALAVGWLAILCTGRYAETAKGHDPPEIVLDEIAGMLTSYAGISAGWGSAILGFILFRFFDIVKPPPIRWLEGLRKGWGIVSDDIMAGIYANVVLRIIAFFFWGN